jgi:hypothetical protein
MLCSNHPTVETDQACGRCGRPFCDRCLVELSGSHLCGGCKHLAVAELQRRGSVDPRTVIAWARLYDGTAAVLALLSIAYSVMITVGRVTPGSDFGWNEPVADLLLAASFLPPVLSLALAVPPTIGLGSRQPWAYKWQLWMLIPSALFSCLSLSCLGVFTWPCALILMIYWTKPEVRAYCEGS